MAKVSICSRHRLKPLAEEGLSRWLFAIEPAGTTPADMRSVRQTAPHLHRALPNFFKSLHTNRALECYSEIHMEETIRRLALKGVILQRLAYQRIPRLLDIKEMLDRGGTLSGLDLEFLDEVFGDAAQNKYIFDENPDIQDLYTRAVDLFEDITGKALENEMQPATAVQRAD